MLRLCSTDRNLILETDYKCSRLLKLKQPLDVELPEIQADKNSQVWTDASLSFRRKGAERAISALCLNDLPGFCTFISCPDGMAAGFPVLVWGDFVVVFPKRGLLGACVECELALLKRALSGFAKACELHLHLLNTEVQKSRGIVYAEHLLFQREFGFGSSNDSELLVGDARIGELMVRVIPVFACPAHKASNLAHSRSLDPDVRVNHLSLPGFFVAEATVTNGTEVGQGGAVDTEGSMAAVRARYEAIERLTIRSLQGQVGGIANDAIDTPAWIKNFHSARSSESVITTRTNVGFAAHTNFGTARFSALCELLERKIAPHAYAHKRAFRIDERCWVDETLLARLARAGLAARLYICENGFAPTVIAFTHDAKGRGSSATATSPSISSCVQSAVLNALGMYIARSNSQSLLELRQAWCWDLQIEEPGLDQFGFRIDRILSTLRPVFYVAPDHLVDRFLCPVSVVACHSELGGYSYRHGEVPESFWTDFSAEARALMLNEGAMISLSSAT